MKQQTLSPRCPHLSSINWYSHPDEMSEPDDSKTSAIIKYPQNNKDLLINLALNIICAWDANVFTTVVLYL